jgi:Fic family protein
MNMDISKFTAQSPGQLIEIAGVPGVTHAYIPNPLPPDWGWPEPLWPLLLKAREELARLDGVGMHLPNPQLLLTPMQNREAQRSSSLEGTIATPEQLALFEMAPTDSILEQNALDAAHEVSNYGRALRFRAETQEKLPLSLRLIRALHQILLEGVRGSKATPGEFRRSQVQVGSNARYVPPPANVLPECLDRFEKYLHEPKKYDPLVEAFLVHYLFEAIHPFGVGNGRVGRLLLAITVQEWCGLSGQLLYMSAYFDEHKDEYIDRLFRVSTHADWEGWIQFCLNGVIEQSVDTQQRCSQLLDLRESYKKRLADKKASARLNLLMEGLFANPVATASGIMRTYHVSHPTARADLNALVGLDILKEVQLKQRRQKGYYCPEILQITYEDSK